MSYLRKAALFLITVPFFMSFSGILKAQESTAVTVRVKAKNAKFIGDETGGALVTIRNAENGKLLAKGVTKGSTGNTKKLVIQPKTRYGQLHTKGSAKFTAQLQLKRPTYVTISAVSTYRDVQEVTVSTQMWLIPGRDITGDGIILTMPGFLVQILQPESAVTNNNHIHIKARVVMMCGCSTKPGGLWDSKDYVMKALIQQNGETLATVPLHYAGKTSTYEANYNAPETGKYQITVYVFNSKTANSGLDRTTISVE